LNGKLFCSLLQPACYTRPLSKSGYYTSMHRLLFAIAGLILLAVVSLLLALRSQTFVLGSLHWAMETFSGLSLKLVDPRIDVYAGLFSVGEVHVMPQNSDGPALLSVLDLNAQVPASVRAASVLIYVSDSEEETNPKPVQWLGYLRWLPTELRIGQAHLITASANTWIFPLKEIRGDRLDSGNYRLTMDADYEGEPLQAMVDLLAVDAGWGATAAESTIVLTAPDSDSKIELAGTLAGTEDDFQYNFELTAFYKDIREFLKGFEGGGDLAGELRLQGTMQGDSRQFTLSDATFLLDNMPAYGFEVGGTLEYVFTGKSHIALVGTGELDSLAYLVDWIDVDVGDFGQVQSSLRLSGSLDRPVIDAFRLVTSNNEGLTVSLNGRLNLYESETDDTPQASAVFVDLQGPSLKVLNQWLGEQPYDPGPWRASGRLTGDPSLLAVQDIVIESGTPEGLQLRLTGSVGSITPPEEGQEDYTVAAIALQLSVEVPDSVEIGALLDRTDIPPHHSITASMALTGSSDELQLTDGQLNITASDLQINIGPLVGTLSRSAARPVSGLAGPVNVALSDTAALSQYSSLPMPVLGPLQLKGTLGQKAAVFQLLDIVATVGEGEPKITTRGRIGNLVDFGGLSLSSNLQGIDLSTLLALALPEFNFPGPLGALEGSFTLSDDQGSWNIPALSLAGGTDDTALSFNIDGNVADLTGLISANLNTRFHLRDSALLQALTGLALPPANGSLAVTSTAESIRGTLEAQLGQTKFNAEGEVTLADNAIQAVSLSLDTPHLYLQDLALGSSEGESPAQQEEDAKPSDTVLESLRRNAPPYPVDIALKVDGISGDYSAIDSLRVRISGSENRYTLQQFTARYNQALTEIRGIIDLNPELPAASLAGEATTLPLGAILKDVGVDANVSGALTILGGVTVMGDSPQVLLENLNGSVAFALEKAIIEGAAYDLLATDLLAWIYSGALTDKSTFIDCTMAKFNLRQGVATTDSLYIESAKMVATGKAEFNLVEQRMDVRITPLSKSRLLQVPSEIRLKGDMSNPKAEISTVNAVADATTAVLMLIPDLTLKLFGINQSSSEDYRPCHASLAD
jgi:hypothetical protein